jgi:hypothetical protein
MPKCRFANREDKKTQKLLEKIAKKKSEEKAPPAKNDSRGSGT